MDKRSYIQSKIMMFCLVSHFGESFYRDIVLQSKCQTVFYRAKNSRMCNGINTYHTSQVVHVSNSFYHKLKLVSEYRRIFHLVTVLFASAACLARSRHLSLCRHQRHATETPTQSDRIRAGMEPLRASKKCRYYNDF